LVASFTATDTGKKTKKKTNQSWDQNCLIMLYFEFRSHDQFVSHKNNHEIKICNNARVGFNLMIKVSTTWLILLDKFDLMNKLHFDLMIENLTSWKSWISISWNLTSWPPLEKGVQKVISFSDCNLKQLG
jgi:hypothetical protein